MYPTQPFTHTGILDELKATDDSNRIFNIHMPLLDMHYLTFAQWAGIDMDTHYSLHHYINHATYADKQALFKQIGFNVLFMTLDVTKLLNYTTNPNADDKSLDEAFLDNERNIFIITIETYPRVMYFVIEYHDPQNPLAEYTVDRKALAEEKARSEKMSAIFKRWKQNKQQNK